MPAMHVHSTLWTAVVCLTNGIVHVRKISCGILAAPDNAVPSAMRRMLVAWSRAELLSGLFGSRLAAQGACRARRRGVPCAPGHCHFNTSPNAAASLRFRPAYVDHGATEAAGNLKSESAWTPRVDGSPHPTVTGTLH